MALINAITLIFLGAIILYKSNFGFQSKNVNLFIKIWGVLCLLLGIMALFSYFKNNS